MRRRGSLGPPLLLALVLYSAWSPSAFVGSPPPRPRGALAFGAAGDEDVAIRNLLLGVDSFAGVEAPTKAAAPAAKTEVAAPAEKAAKAPAVKAAKKVPAVKAAEKVPAKVEEAPAADLKAPAAKEGEPSGLLTKNDQGRWRFVEVDRDAALLAAFQAFDMNGNGELSREELQGAAAKFGESEEQIGQLLKQFDGKSIKFDQFKELIASVEEGCDVEKEECFSLRNPSTWGLLFRRRRK
eukprot:TRINITY_DN6371_c0_g1_i1.p1 TRINITY_DN6371_c0_g1~~TRINITY_DN6371_c0_g1_i1.p1  ORF type:complete len:239 (-),score=62.58 TRINITY_DN6371_c0_g1_i1:180-896(-)